MAIDANTGSVLHNQAGDEPRYPASLTKMMTLYMAFELIELGRLKETSTIKMTQEGADAAPSKLEVKPGTEITVLDAMKALITKSANDVAVALAQHIAGTEDNFARLMTRKAHDLGMTSTTFKNASGLPDPEQVTTARDMLTLALRLRDDFPRHYELFATRVFNYGGDSYRNHNGLLSRYRGTDGIKTGYTRLSGFNLVASVNRDGKRVVAAVFGGRTARVRDNMMEQVLNKALAKASTQVTRKPSLIARAPQPARARPVVAAEPPPAVTAAVRPPPAPGAVEERAAPSQVAEAGAAPSHAITMAKVRRVLMGSELKRQVAPGNDSTRPRPAYAVADATATPAPPAQPAAAARDDPLPRFAPTADVLRKETAAPTQAPGQPPSTLQAQVEALGGPADARSTQPVTTGANVEPRTAPQAGPRTQPRAQPRAEPKAPQVSRDARGGFEIQIGAFSDSAEAESQMASARQRAGGVLDSYPAVAVPAQKGTSQIYRARFKGFDATAAASTCGQLKKLQIDCFVIKAE